MQLTITRFGIAALWVCLAFGCAGGDGSGADSSVPDAADGGTPPQADAGADTKATPDTAVVGTCNGGCAEGSRCINDKCVPSFCPPAGPFGTHPGDVLTDVVVKDCDGNDVHIHELCGAPAGYFNLLAGW